MSPALTAEAFGTLLALSELKRIRLGHQLIKG